jgi:SIR2-like protein
LEPDEFRALSSDFRSLAEFYRLEKGSLEALSGKMAHEWQVSDEKLAASRTHSEIVRLDFPTVYTTNYDHLLERAYRLRGKRFNKIVTAKDFARSDPALPTIVKFHGDLDDASSLVLTETDYLDRLSFEQPLDIKLAADAFGKAVLFIGYSVSDINLRLLLYRLHGIWRASGCAQARPRSYVLMTKENQVQERILDSWGVAPLIAANGDETNAVARFLGRLTTQNDSGIGNPGVWSGSHVHTV